MESQYSLSVILRKRNLYIQKLKQWNEYIDEMVEKNQWFKALQSGMLIYQSKIKMLACISPSLRSRQMEMKPVLEKVAFTYIMFLLKPIDIHHKLSYKDLQQQVKLVMGKMG